MQGVSSGCGLGEIDLDLLEFCRHESATLGNDDILIMGVSLDLKVGVCGVVVVLESEVGKPTVTLELDALLEGGYEHLLLSRILSLFL